MTVDCKSKLRVIALVLVIVGALNWLYVGAFPASPGLVAELVRKIKTSDPTPVPTAMATTADVMADEASPLERIIYVLVGVAAIYLIVHEISCNDKNVKSGSSVAMSSEGTF
jgi:uncharacterized membrane protein YuzA (DUF378 family)